MLTERVRRQIERLLHEANIALSELDWNLVRDRAKVVLALDPDNQDAAGYLAAADRAEAMGSGAQKAGSRRAEAELEAEMESLKWLVDSSAVGVLVVEASSRKVLLANREVQRILGFPLGPEYDWEWYEHANYERRKPSGQLYAQEDLPLSRALEYGETVRAEEMWLEFPDGRRVRILVSATPVYSEDGRLVGVVLISQDITPLDLVIPAHEQVPTDSASERRIHLPLSGGGYMTLDFAFRTEQGPQRQTNEDTIYHEPVDSARSQQKGWVCVVADGMGGHAMGEVASLLAVKTVVDAYYSGYYTGAEGLRHAATRANSAVYEASENNPAYRGMGTTLTAALFLGDMLYLAHVGDSRAYLVRQGLAQQLTNDHTLVAELVRAKAITQEQAATNPYRNVLTKTVGGKASVEIEMSQHKISDGDLVMICSDGVYKRLTSQQIAQVLLSQPLQGAVDSLIRLTKERDGDDDMSLIIVACFKGL